MATETKNGEDGAIKVMLDAAARGDTAELCKLQDQGADLNATDEEGWSPLILASKDGHLATVNELIKRGAKANPSKVAHTALRAAALYGQDEVIRALLAAQGDPNFPSLHGRTPLMGAAMNGHPGAAAILLSAGARHGAANDVGETALDLCKVKSNTEVAKVIVNGAARQALKAGSWSEAAKLLAALSEQADDVVNIEYEGETLLDLAVASCNEEAAASLIAMGGTKGRANTADSSYPTVSIPCVPPPPATTETSPHPHIQQADADQLKRADRRALVIGGTQFMGRLTVQALDEAGWEVVMITRGRSKNPHPPRIKHIACNRNTERERFRELVQEHGPWQIVVDFVAFHKAAVMDVALAVGAHPTHYILISTDSVYMACQLPARTPETRDAKVREGDAVRPESAKAKMALVMRDKYQYEYGSNKLACEEALSELRRRTGFCFTALRLCDVMGPYDNLGIFLRIQALLTKGHPVPVARLPGASERLSLVFARDVAAAVLATIEAGSKVHGESINIAGPETPTMEELVTKVAEALGMPQPQFAHDKPAFFPSVSFGAISVSKARELLAWTPTPMDAWVRETVLWYQDSKNAAYTASYALMPSA